MRDKVGNTPAVDEVGADECLPGGSGDDCDKGAGPIGVNEAARGAAAPETAIGQVKNAFVFTVDTEGPTLDTGKTGFSLKNAGVSSGESKESEKQKQARLGPDHLRVGARHCPHRPCDRGRE